MDVTRRRRIRELGKAEFHMETLGRKRNEDDKCTTVLEIEGKEATKRHRNKKDKRRYNVVGDRAAKAGAPGAALKSLERKNKLKVRKEGDKNFTKPFQHTYMNSINHAWCVSSDMNFM
ncbi:predicted protein [Histoplasma capsulatum var. duboisii H88]|uniref:Predicted protein n=1 Tax=Ajellomyces capsulatus (strain H88) TaxID=544711 RepID=F0UKL7_AJEC8|nr:predicted protein [Histoplasma capsulatum var. duboisii H88]